MGPMESLSTVHACIVHRYGSIAVEKSIWLESELEMPSDWELGLENAHTMLKGGPPNCR